jgi:putative Holliday junction resolvase
MRVLGIDYGEKRVGFAVSDPSGFLSLALRMAEVRSESDILRQVAEICREVEAERVVVGLPLNMDGTRGPMAEKVNGFVGRLSETLSIPVETFDERLSSSAVERSLIEADVSRAKRKNLRDKLAAQIILQGYLDRMAMEDRESDGGG